MRFYCLVVALAFVATVASDSRGESKQPSQPQAKAAQQQAAPDQRGTENSPVVVKVLPAQENEEKAKAEGREHDEKRQFDADTLRLTKITVALIFLQVFIFAAQAYFLWGTLRATADAANAAKAAAEHIPRVERPYLFMTVNGEALRKPLLDAYIMADPANQDALVITPLEVEFSFENQGRTSAIIREISASLHHWSELPAIPPAYTAELGLLPTNRYVAPNGATGRKEVSVKTPVSYQAATAICGRGDSFIWFFGRVLYDDVFGNTHEHAFVWRFSMGDFLPYYGNEKYIRNT